jgi:hypothetical protein
MIWRILVFFELLLIESIEWSCRYFFCSYNTCICKIVTSVCSLNEVDDMPKVTITREEFLDDRQGRTFADVLDDPEQPFEEVLVFFSEENRQRRMEESEIHHDRAAMAGVVRELESVPAIDQFLSDIHAQQTQRFRQAIGVLVRIVMQRRGWKKTGRKGSLGVRAAASKISPSHNTGGLSFWFVRAERYTLANGMPFQSVTQRSQTMHSVASKSSRVNNSKG